jgi:hypothetical protein
MKNRQLWIILTILALFVPALPRMNWSCHESVCGSYFSGCCCERDAESACTTVKIESDCEGGCDCTAKVSAAPRSVYVQKAISDYEPLVWADTVVVHQVSSTERVISRQEFAFLTVVVNSPPLGLPPGRAPPAC